MSDDAPKSAPIRKTGLSPKEQKLQALREKMAKTASGAKPIEGTGNAGFKAKGNFTKKAAFQRKAT